jgi:hypothetical protein
MLRASATVRSLAALGRNMRDETIERMARHLGQLEAGMSWFLVMLPHWIECVPEEAMTPVLLQRLSGLDSLRLSLRLEEIETLAYANDLGLVAPAIATIAAEFKLWHTEFKVDLQRRAYFEEFEPLC